MFDLHSPYPYMEEVNEGIVKAVQERLRQRFLKAGGSAKPRFLDAGCGYGQLGEALGRLGVKVYGIEANPAVVRKAQVRLEKVVLLDITNFKLAKTKLSKLTGGKPRFDAIVFSDVLEHLGDPLEVLKFYDQFLLPDGRIYVSLTNLVNWEQRLKFMFGHFDYEKTGVMDQTHLHFFTYKTAKLLLAEAGYEVESTDHTPYFIRSFLPLIKRFFPKNDPADGAGDLMNSPFFRFYQKYVYPIEYTLSALWPGLFAFRMILVAKRPCRQSCPHCDS